MSETPLAGRRILLTGATGVLGRALARQLAAQGAELILLARRKARLEDLDDELAGQALTPPLLVELDFLRAKDGHYQELAQALSTEGLDELILCQGLHTGLHPLEHLKSKDWQRIMDVNLNASFQLIHHLLPLLKARKGQIIGISDAPAREHKAYWGAYAVSKAGLDALLDVCADETENQIRVTRFEPAALPSPIRAAVYPGETRDDLPDVDRTARELLSLLRCNDSPARA